MPGEIELWKRAFIKVIEDATPEQVSALVVLNRAVPLAHAASPVDFCPTCLSFPCACDGSPTPQVLEREVPYSGDIKPQWAASGDGEVPLCDERCPEFDGKRCGVMGNRPGRLCEPWVANCIAQYTERAD